MKTLLLFLLLCRMSSSVKYSLTYMISAFSGDPNMPDFMMTGEFGQMQLDYCDSNKTRRSYPGFWEKVNLVDPQFLKFYSEQCFETQPQVYKGVISKLKENNPNEAGYILQEMGGCELDGKNGDVNSFARLGYDGEDFMEVDMKTFTWIVQNPLSAPIKQMWETSPAYKTHLKQLFTEGCPQWLKMFVSLGPLKETELPSVSLLQKTPSSPVSCHATGFYPNTALMFWRKDGEEIHENVEHGEILPNHDWTFQLSVKLEVSSIPPEDWRRYDCVFQLSGLENNITTILDKNMIRTNLVSPSEFPSGAVIGGCVGLLLLLLCITGLFFWKRRNNGKHQNMFVYTKYLRERLSDHIVTLDGISVASSSTVRNLGVLLDQDLSFKAHINQTCKTAFFHLRNIARIRNMLSNNDAEKLIHAFVTSRLDYCNSLLVASPKNSLKSLQLVQNAAARLLTGTGRREHITPVLASLHWLPVDFRSYFKILLLTYKALNGKAPSYLKDALQPYHPNHALRSQNAGLLVVPRISKSTVGGRAFSYQAPVLWNLLPAHVREADTVSTFKIRLKTYLYEKAYVQDS